jgi:hypothetical protein
MKKTGFNSLLFTALVLFLSFSFQQDDRTRFFPKTELKAGQLPAKEDLWVFILAGQSNMAGRGLVEPQDTIPDRRIFTINKTGEIIIAKEPLHFYEPTLTGLDCGLSFAKALIRQIPDSISVLLIPCAVGGSSISQWLNDITYREVKLLSNFREKAATGMHYGQIKGILWHQGESDTSPVDIPLYRNRITQLFGEFRRITNNDQLPVLIGELGSYSESNELWQGINEQIRAYASSDPYSRIINTSDLKEKGDRIHFNSEGQRIMGERFASEFVKCFYKAH